MKTSRAIGSTLSALMLTGLVLTGPASAQSGGASSKTTFTVGTTTDMITMNPFKAIGTEYDTFFMVYDQLLNFNQKDLTAAPGLAESWTSSPDKKTWTFKIRTGVKWSDGVPLTSRDIAWTFNYIVKNQMGTFISYFPFNPTFEAPDDTTLIWHSPVPTVAPLAPPWVPILPEHIWSRFGNDKQAIKGFKNVPTVGSGPFRLVEWKQGEFYRLEANPDYWDGPPHVQEIVYQIFDNQETMVQALKTGQIDFAEGLIPTLFNSLKGAPHIATHEATAGVLDDLAFNLNKGNYGNTGHSALQDLTVRQAIATGIDKQAIVDRVLHGDGTVGDSFVLPTSAQWHWDPTGTQVIQYDPQKANLMLDQAGYTDTNGDGIRNMPNGGPNIVLDTLALTDLPYSVDTGKLIKGWLANIGIDINLKNVSEKKATDLWYSHDWDIYLWDWGPDPDPNFILSTFTTQSCNVWSDSCWSNPTYDKLYQEQRRATSIEQRQKIVSEMQQMIYQQSPVICLDYEDDLQAYRNDQVTGFIPQPAPNGYYVMQYGSYTYRSVRRVSGTTSAAAAGGIPGAVWIAILAGVAVLLLAVVLIRRRVIKEEDVA